jgi:hypothetical protein
LIVLTDNDILLKLAQCDLFDEFLAVLDVTVSDIRILGTARFSITAPRHRNRIGEINFARMQSFLNQIADIDTDPDPVAIAALTEQADKNIDAGEAVLFAVSLHLPDSVIVTGDKKSLTGLAEAAASDPVCEQLYQSLTGRLICFELLLIRILDRFGFDAIRQKLIHGRKCDSGLTIWLGSGLNASESSFREGLVSYLNDARQASGLLLSP